MRPLLTLAAALALAAPAAAQPSPPLVGTTWTLSALTDGGRLVTPGRLVTRPTLRLDGRVATGITPCNVYRAPYAARGDVLRFGPPATTRRACPDRVDGLEERFLTLLRGVNRAERSGETLTLYAGGEGRLVFSAGTTAAPAPEVRVNLGGNWTLSGGTALSPVPGHAPALTFTAGRVSGTAGCNRLTGAAQTQDGHLTLGPLAATRMACAPAVNEQEAAFLAFLGAPLTARVEGEALTLTDPAGKTLVFRRQGGGPENAGAQSAALEGAYTLATVNGQPAPRTAQPVTLSFRAGRVGGSDGCNTFGGEYRLEGTRLVLAGPLASTLRACPDPQETVNLPTLLAARPTLTPSATGLTLRADGTTLEFTRRP